MTDLIFTTLLKQFPCLWDNQDLLFYNRRQKKKCKENLIKLCQKSGIEITMKQLEEKLLAYRRKLKRQNKIIKVSMSIGLFIFP